MPAPVVSLRTIQTDFDKLFNLRISKTVAATKASLQSALNNRGNLHRAVMLTQLKSELNDGIADKYQSDHFLVFALNALKNTQHRYESEPVTNFFTNDSDDFHLPQVRRNFLSHAAQNGWISKAIKLNDVQLVKRLADFMALESLADLEFLTEKKPAPMESSVQPTRNRRMVIAHKGMTEVVRIFEMMAEARLIEKVNQELLTTIFSKQLDDGSVADWDANSYSAQKSEALPKNPEERAAQTSGEYMVNFVNGLLRLMSPEAKRKLNRS